MKSNYNKTIFGAVMMALFLVIGFGASAATAQAQYPYPDNQYRRPQDDQDDRRRPRDDWQNRRHGRSWDGYPNFGDSLDFRQTALNAGYNEGIKEGRNNRNHGGNTYDLNRFSAYRKATKDYNSHRGDVDHYRRYFQMAFQNGYEDGLRGY